MTTDGVLTILKQALSSYAVSGILFALCAFGGVIISLGLKDKGVVFVLGVGAATASVYAGTLYTVMPLWTFVLMAFCGFLAGFKAPARARR